MRTDADINPVPEPATMLLLGTGFVRSGRMVWKKKQKRAHSIKGDNTRTDLAVEPLDQSTIYLTT